MAKTSRKKSRKKSLRRNAQRVPGDPSGQGFALRRLVENLDQYARSAEQAIEAQRPLARSTESGGLWNDWQATYEVIDNIVTISNHLGGFKASFQAAAWVLPPSEEEKYRRLHRRLNRALHLRASQIARCYRFHHEQ